MLIKLVTLLSLANPGEAHEIGVIVYIAIARRGQEKRKIIRSPPSIKSSN